MVFTNRYASTSGTPVFAVGRSPTPRPGGLHHVCASPVYLPAGGVQAPWPLRLVSATKWVSWSAGGVPAFWSNHRSVQCQVDGSVGETELPGWPSLGAAPEKYWLAHQSVWPAAHSGPLVANHMHLEIQVPYWSI